MRNTHFPPIRFRGTGLPTRDLIPHGSGDPCHFQTKGHVARAGMVGPFPVRCRLSLVLCYLFSVLCLLSSASARAAELTDLGQGLSYLRIESLADSAKALNSAAAGTKALVLDLRRVTASDESIGALRAALATRTAPNAPLFILVSPATPEAVARSIHQSPLPVLTLGVAGSLPAPKVVVHIDAASDRLAYDALTSGATISELISGKIPKDRYDEASLVQEFKNGNHDAEPPPPADTPALKPANSTEKAPAPAVPVVSKTEPSPVERPADRVLQRAVHLHRALLALRR